MHSTAAAAAPYADQGHDAVRAAFELAWFECMVPRLLGEAPGGEVLDLGCGDGAVTRLAAGRLSRYVGVDFSPPPLPANETGVDYVDHDLREGIGPVGGRPFDLYLGTFGVASHLSPRELRRLLLDVSAHARPGAVVAIEALGRDSLEWPQLWDTAPGPARTIPYSLAADVLVHPWSPVELFGLFAQAGIEPLRAFDRTLQAGPKTACYWPGLPALRGTLNAMLGGSPVLDELAAPLPPLPAGKPALVHHTLAGLRRALVGAGSGTASAVWDLEPPTGGGFGHGLLVVGRVL
ncbi:MAG: methyltransferase domain-containing protein [Actinomycetota bacterium]|nr:methyltransferase domain-containing protein [Actinomycetota bacterium]